MIILIFLYFIILGYSGFCYLDDIKNKIDSNEVGKWLILIVWPVALITIVVGRVIESVIKIFRK